MSEFTNQVVIVTGAGKGAGRAIAQAFALRGAIVAANDITPIDLDDTVHSIKKCHGKVKSYIADISKKMPVQAMVNKVLDDWGRIDILIINARVEPKAPVLDMDEWEWRRTLDVNLTGAFLVLQSVGRVMKAAGQGVITLLIDLSESNLNKTAYNCSSAALSALTRSAARELGDANIHLNAVRLDDAPRETLVETVLTLCNRVSPQVMGLTLTPGDENKTGC